MHAVSTMFQTEERPETYVNQCYMKSTQLKIYSYFINPIRGTNQWSSDKTMEPILPPVLRRPLGRPHKKMRKDADEANEANEKRFKISKKGSKRNYTKCGKPGHNVKTCRGEVGGNSRINPATVAKSYRSKLQVSFNCHNDI